MSQAIQITKLDAALRQLRTAIILYFNSADIVSIHTLVAAAYNVLLDIRDHRNDEFTMFKDANEIVDEYKEEFKKMLKKSENFFKHADNDPQSTLTYHPLTAELLLIDACDAYIRLTGEEPDMVALFKGWHAILHPEYYVTGSPRLTQIARYAKTQYKETDRLEYMQNGLVSLSLLKSPEVIGNG